MLVSGGQIIAIGPLLLDENTLSGDGIFTKLGVKNGGSQPGIADVVHDTSLSGKGTEESPLRVNISAISGSIVSGVSGLNKVYTNGTLSGDGTSGNPLGVIGGGGSVLEKDIRITNTIGDLKYGTTLAAGTSYQDIWTSALSVYEGPSIGAITIKPEDISTKEQPGEVSVSSLEFSFTAGSSPVTGYSFFIGTKEYAKSINVEAYASKTVSDIFDTKYTDDITFQGKVVDEKGTVKKTAVKKIDFYWPYFYGICDTAEEEIDLEKAKNKISKPKNNNEVTFSMNKDEGILWYAFDKDYSDLTAITDKLGNNSLENYEKFETYEYKGHSYKLYKNKNFVGKPDSGKWVLTFKH